MVHYLTYVNQNHIRSYGCFVSINTPKKHSPSMPFIEKHTRKHMQTLKKVTHSLHTLAPRGVYLDSSNAETKTMTYMSTHIHTHTFTHTHTHTFTHTHTLHTRARARTHTHTQIHTLLHHCHHDKCTARR